MRQAICASGSPRSSPVSASRMREEAYAAIRQANPGGLGEVPRHGVDAEPTITLLEAMKAAEGHDRIAWNYSHDFADIFDLGLPRLRDAARRGWPAPFATTSVYLGFLSTIPDTLIERKFGHAQALEVQAEAKALAAKLNDSGDRGAVEQELKDFDRSLKGPRSQSWNIGRSNRRHPVRGFTSGLRTAPIKPHFGTNNRLADPWRPGLCSPRLAPTRSCGRRTVHPEHFRRLAVDAPLTAQAGVNWFQRTREGLVKWPRLVVLV